MHSFSLQLRGHFLSNSQALNFHLVQLSGAKEVNILVLINVIVIDVTSIQNKLLSCQDKHKPILSLQLAMCSCQGASFCDTISRKRYEIGMRRMSPTENNPQNKIRILLVDDHTILRAGVKLMLSAQPDFVVAGEARDGHEGVTEALRLQPDVVLMDITMPDMNGIQATVEIKRQISDAKVLILTMHDSEIYLFQCLRSGASGYISKEAADTELVTAIRTVHEGNVYLSPLAQAIMVDDYLQRVSDGDEKDSYSSLTEREREILKLIAEGKTNNQIAEKLSISPKTVDTHRTHIMDKLNMHSRTELVKFAMRRGLLDD